MTYSKHLSIHPQRQLSRYNLSFARIMVSVASVLMCSALGGLAFSFRSLQAQEDKNITGEIDAAKAAVTAEAPKEATMDGWKYNLSLGTNLSVSNSRNVVGTDDGSTVQFNLLSDGFLGYVSGNHNWTNEAKIVYGQTRTPVLPTFIKSADNFLLKSTYAYRVPSIKWFGPFARVNVTTSLFPGYIVKPADSVLAITSLDGTVDNQTLVGEEQFQLTTAIEPLLVKGVVGALATPIDKGAEIRVASHIGAGAEKVVAKGGYALADNKDTTEIEIQQLQSYTNVGAELEIVAAGAPNAIVSWSGTIGLFQPIITTAETDLKGTEILSVDAAAKVSVKLAKWASLDYVISAKKYPLIVPLWQIQTGLLLTATFNVI